METWSFAVQVNNDGVMSSVAVVLALLVQIVSGSLELVPHGLGICQTLLQERQLKSISKNMSCEKSKGFVLSPTLRLLREAVSLDGGAFAKRIFRARNYTFASLARNLEIGHASDSQDDARKTSVRTNAARYLLSCIRYLHSDGRKELLANRELLSHLTFMLKTDPPHLIIEILDVLRAHVLADERIPREAKLKSFNTKTLIRILALYTYGTSAQSEEDRAAVSDKAHGFLLYVCTTPGAGVLYPSTSLYPKPSNDDMPSHGPNSSLARLEGSLSDTKFSQEIPVYNFVLSEFVQKLKPWSSLKHSELLVAIFSAAPELVADYFINTRSFTFEPKLSMTWIGYAAFLFNTMQIPLPAAFGDRARYAAGPPPTSILLDNIIPLPINQKVLSRCFSMKSDLTSFFATRILVSALDKLSTALEMLQGDTTRVGPAWVDASRGLVDGFCQRIPDMKEIVRLHKTVPPENFLHKTLASRLLRLYYEVVPRVALAANFDVSPLLVDALQKLDDKDIAPDARTFGVMELENLVSIAAQSPGMRWFAKVEGVASSPFTALLRLLCGHDQSTTSLQIRRVLGTVALENQLVSKSAGLRPLLQALRSAASLEENAGGEVPWSFVDNCINRCATSPLKYLDLQGSLAGDTSSLPSDTISLLNVAIVEQLPYATGSSDDRGKKSLARFLTLYFNAADLSEESSKLVRALYKKVREHMKSAGLSVKDIGDKSEVKILRNHEVEHSDADGTPQGNDTEAGSTHIDDSKLEEALHVPIPEEQDTNALVRWSTRNVEDLVDDGWISRLLGLLSSEHVNIRKEAFTNILKMAAKVKESSYEEKEQVWLLLSEAAESSRACVDAGPVPSAFTAFATHALEVLRNPLHPLYPKINTFLTRGPVWAPGKVPLAHDIIHGEPSEDDRYYVELTWLLTYLLDCLITPADLAVLRRQRWFEKILALGSNPYLRANLRTRILRLVYRATVIESGSTTLVTRFGIISWLDAQRAACSVPDEAALIAALMRRVWDTCDQPRVSTWSRGGVQKLVQRLAEN